MSLSRTRKAVLSATAASTLLLTAACGGTGEDDTPQSAATETAGTPGDTDGADAGTYVAGDYEAEGSYRSPGGSESVIVELSLEEDGTITDVTVIPQATDGANSEQFQGQFAGGIADEVVGVRIDDLNVSRVSGSSLTSGGFNEAIEAIKADASA